MPKQINGMEVNELRPLDDRWRPCPSQQLDTLFSIVQKFGDSRMQLDQFFCFCQQHYVSVVCVSANVTVDWILRCSHGIRVAWSYYFLCLYHHIMTLHKTFSAFWARVIPSARVSGPWTDSVETMSWTALNIPHYGLWVVNKCIRNDGLCTNCLTH